MGLDRSPGYVIKGTYQGCNPADEPWQGRPSFPLFFFSWLNPHLEKQKLIITILFSVDMLFFKDKMKHLLYIHQFLQGRTLWTCAWKRCLCRCRPARWRRTRCFPSLRGQCESHAEAADSLSFGQKYGDTAMLLPCHQGSTCFSVRFSVKQHVWNKAMLRKDRSSADCITLQRLEPKRRSNLVTDCHRAWKPANTCAASGKT